MLPDKLAFLDVETTGLSVTRDRIIEIGILKVEKGKVIDTFSSLINPQTYVSPYIENITNIPLHDLEKAPTFYEVQERILEMLDGSVMVAHNVRFDYGFLRNEFKRYGKSFTSKHFCTARLSRFLFPKIRHHNLDSIIQRFSIQCENRHRAFDDAKVLWEYLQIMQKTISEKKFTEAIKKAMLKPSIPPLLQSKLPDTLPENPGVYIFYGDSEVPLYVGKSINIRERVLSHFASDHLSSKEMNISRQLKHVETLVTAGELGALLRESYLVKTLQPFYNRQLRFARNIIVLKKHVNSNGYEEIISEEVEHVDPSEIENIITVSRSKRQAKEFLAMIAKHFSLCEKLLHIEKTRDACFAYRLGVCKGACIGKENPIVYNAKVAMAFANHAIKKWPFDGPIIITERNNILEIEEQFLVDKWCLLGSRTDEGEFKSKEKHEFDVDTYKVLVNYIKSPKNTSSIKSINTSSEVDSDGNPYVSTYPTPGVY